MEKINIWKRTVPDIGGALFSETKRLREKVIGTKRVYLGPLHLIPP